MSMHAITPLVLSFSDWCSSCRLSLGTFSWYQYFGVFLFLWASWHQWNCHNILAKLRLSATGRPVKLYRIPYGDWFEYVSSPHYLAEILIYISFFIIQMGQNIYVGLILLFTIQNISLGATVTHEWYHNKFKDYPKNRNKILPFLYQVTEVVFGTEQAELILKQWYCYKIKQQQWDKEKKTC